MNQRKVYPHDEIDSGKVFVQNLGTSTRLNLMLPSGTLRVAANVLGLGKMAEPEAK